jgi:hypothetical protein
MVNARARQGGKDRAYKIGALVLMAVAVAAVGWAAKVGLDQIGRWLFSENERFVVRTLDIASSGRLPAANIREYGRLAEGMNLFELDVEKVRSDLESVPVIKSVEIRRLLPDTLRIRVTERTPVARLGADDRVNHFAVDREGFVLGPSSRSPALPAITGLREFGIAPGHQITNAVLADALQVIETCETAGLGTAIRFATIDVGREDYLDVRLAEGPRAWLSRTDVRRKLEWLAAGIEKAREMGKAIEFMDLTVDRNPPAQFVER